MKLLPHGHPHHGNARRGGYTRMEKSLMVFFSLVCIFCGIWLVAAAADAAQSRAEIAALASSFRAVPGNSAGSSVPARPVSAAVVSSAPGMQVLPRFRQLYAQNADLAGWLTIDGTAVDYPVMLTPRSPEYYLHRGFERKYEFRGLPFLDAQIDVNDSANYLIYGHNMKDGTEFAALQQYRAESFYRTHRLIRFDTIYATGRYEVIAAFYSQIYNRDQDVFKYYQFYGPASPEKFSNYVRNVKKLSFYETGVTAKPGDQLLTLSTCSSHTEDGRLVVVAKKIGS